MSIIDVIFNQYLNVENLTIDKQPQLNDALSRLNHKVWNSETKSGAANTFTFENDDVPKLVLGASMRAPALNALLQAYYYPNKEDDTARAYIAETEKGVTSGLYFHMLHQFPEGLLLQPNSKIVFTYSGGGAGYSNVSMLYLDLNNLLRR